MKNHTVIPTLVLFAMMSIAFVTLMRIGESTIAVTLIAGMVAGLLAGVMYPPKSKGIYKMTDDERRRMVGGLDDTAGYLVKESTLRYIVEDAVNKDRDTHLEWHMQELRKGVEARTQRRIYNMR